MAKTDPINTANPAGSSDPKQGDDHIRTLAKAVAEILGVDHYTGASSPYNEDAAGEHAKVTLHAPISDPSNVANKGHLYIKDVNSKAELHFQDEDGDAIQLTSGGEVLFGSLSSIAKNTYLKAIDNAGTSTIDLIKGNASDKPVLKAGAELSTSGDPTEAAGIACKEYVDGAIAAATTSLSAYTTKDSDNADMLPAHAYEAQTDGFVAVTAEEMDAGEILYGYVGATDDPAGAGDLIQRHEPAGTNRERSIFFAVPSGAFFEIVTDTASTVVIRWISLATALSEPVDQD